MSHRCLGAAFTVIAVLSLAPVLAAAQSTNTTALPRTPWGQPDLQGVWDFRTITPLERPSDLAGKPVLTDEEAARFGCREGDDTGIACSGRSTQRPGEPFGRQFLGGLGDADRESLRHGPAR